MRLIDADVAKKAVHEEFDECLVWDESGEYTSNVIEEILEALPIVDAVPVRHGKWIIKSNFDEKVNRNYQHILCSECRTCVAYDWEGKLRTALNYKYCPTCGAKMDAERKEE